MTTQSLLGLLRWNVRAGRAGQSHRGVLHSACPFFGWLLGHQQGFLAWAEEESISCSNENTANSVVNLFWHGMRRLTFWEKEKAHTESEDTGRLRHSSLVSPQQSTMFYSLSFSTAKWPSLHDPLHEVHTQQHCSCQDMSMELRLRT